MPKNVVQVFGFSDFCPTFAENYVMEVDIRYALKINGVSIEELAQRMGVNRQTVYYYIKQGDKNPLSQLERIADAIGIPVTKLFNEPSPDDEINGIAEYKGEFYKIRTVADLKALLAIADKNLAT
jgi:transcriptional regulator with XRE-family HTH domain